MRMRRNGHKTTSGVKFDLIFNLSVPDFLHVEKFWKLDHGFMYFSQFSAAHAQKHAGFYFRSILTPNLKSPWAVSYSSTDFGGTSAKTLYAF